MFFEHKMKSIRPLDRVLEIGPGSTPHPRSDVFLELLMSDESERVSQRGGVAQAPDFSNRPVYYYEGKQFPFKDGEFDYVICSHVIEHVGDPVLFLSEVFRVGKCRGYIEYPLITYDYMYDFDVHLNFLKFNRSEFTLFFCRKIDTGIAQFSPVTSLLREAFEKGWSELTSANKELFFEGFEFDCRFGIRENRRIDELVPNFDSVRQRGVVRTFFSKCLNKLRL